ncbi:hypothetical protein [Parabacteroides sp. PF5-9]|uniref:hypothetical protein n=1 Tax=Parabacteroides sp. PF5-9 TaxID=1742404 RepID=UPI0024764F06|nr:hypothetical protein [Parabacteroides sp. PF5-9]MDH6356566.1 hypothetical protein [Parabacteroides sp. PF5-9]
MKIKERVLSILVCVFMSVNLFAQQKEIVVTDLLGNWEYVMADPVSMAEVKGLCEISQQGDGAVASFKMGDGREMKTSELSKNSQGLFYASMEAEGFELYVYFELEGDVIHCAIDAGVMEIPLEMKKVK